MAATWLELYHDRWAWSERSLAQLRQEVFGLGDDLQQSRLAHVMVVADSQVGKTTLLIRLLGVSDPACFEEAERVLRAGRDEGNSATSVPIRYRWSTDQHRWLLVQGMARRAALFTSDELYDLLADLRSADGTRRRWQACDRPLEIGLPIRLAAQAAPPELRVLDLPGLYAESRPERETAQAMVSRFAPVMNLVVFVQRADGMADAFNDEVIRTNLHLSTWVRRLDGFRVVLTRAFSAASFRKDLERRLTSPDPTRRAPEQIFADLRGFLAEELASSLGGGVDPARLAGVIYPMDLGRSWRDFRTSKAALARLVEPANDRVPKSLAESIKVKEDEDTYHPATPEVAQHIVDRVRQGAASREISNRELQVELKERQELANWLSFCFDLSLLGPADKRTIDVLAAAASAVAWRRRCHSHVAVRWLVGRTQARLRHSPCGFLG